jgi:membrane protease subunit (stomatin/prohibitin family)
MASIQFTANHEDLSTDRGYQFKFFCDKCRNGHLSSFAPSVTGTVGGLMRAAGNLFGGVFGRIGSASYEMQRAVGGKAHDDAFAAAVNECKQHFKQCTRCGKWVCPDVCWNAQAGLCEECAPNLDEEIAAGRAQAMAEAAKAQLNVKAQSTDYTGDVDVSKHGKGPAALACPACGARTAGGRFCGECGAPLAQKVVCKACGKELEGQPKFCPECGGKAG